MYIGENMTESRRIKKIARAESTFNPRRPLRSGTHDYSRNYYPKATPVCQATSGEVVEKFRLAAQAQGLILSDIVADGKIHRCSVINREHGKDGTYLLDLRGFGGFQNFRDGLGWQKWRLDYSGNVWRLPKPDPDAIRDDRILRGLSLWVRQERKRTGKLLFELGKTIMLASERLKANPDNKLAWYALSVAHPLKTKLLQKHNALLSRNLSDRLDVFLAQGASNE
jgi:hypothetical protein